MPNASDSIYLVDNSWQLYGPGATISYSFLASLPTDYGSSVVLTDSKVIPYTYSGAYLTGFSPFTSDQRKAVSVIFHLIESLTTLRFVESPSSQAADIRFGNTIQPATGGVNVRDNFRPDRPTNINDVLIATSTADTRLGGYGFATLIHEICHALGLKHPSGGDAPPPLTGNLTTQDTVMAYKRPMVGSDPNADANGTTPLLLDVKALQGVYGSNPSANYGDSDYIFRDQPASGPDDLLTRDIFIGQRRAIWDTGGVDTLNASAVSTGSLLSLAEGSYSTVGPVRLGVAIAFGSKIENAIGGAGNDTLVGNDLGNRLVGGGGDDLLTRVNRGQIPISPAAGGPIVSTGDAPWDSAAEWL